MGALARTRALAASSWRSPQAVAAGFLALMAVALWPGPTTRAPSNRPTRSPP